MVKLVLLSDTYLIIISAICHCHSFKNELVLVINTAWRKQPIADYVSNHNRTCGESVSENSENFLNQDESKYIYIYSDRREIRIDLILSNQEESQR